MTKDANGQRYLPNFICVGAQKGGTTTLYNVLNKHDDIYMPKKKELHFFDHKEMEPIEKLEDHFRNSKTKQVRGEVTPYYMFHESGIKNIHSVVPNAKIIILLRDPVERAISHYWHAVSKGFETLNIIQALKQENTRLKTGKRTYHQRNSYATRSKYMHQIKRVSQFFEKNHILILKSEDLFAGKKEEWNRIYRHIGVESKRLGVEVSNSRTKRTNITNQEDIAREYLKKELAETFIDVKEYTGISWP